MITLHPGETILLEKRRFWLPIAAEGAVFFFVGFGPLLLAFFSNVVAVPAELKNFLAAHEALFFLMATAWLLAVWVAFFIAWTNYYLDALIVTTRRVIDIEQRGLFARDVAELRIENIEDMRVEIAGIVASLLRFWNLYIQTAGERTEFAIKNIGDPDAAKHVISRQHDELLKTSQKP